jgi:hypothetical protein
MSTLFMLEFPPHISTFSRRLDRQQFRQAMEHFWSRLHRRFFKLERLQSYEESDNASFIAFQQGNVAKSLELIADARAKDADFYIDGARRGLLDVRMRAVVLPLSRYLSWEFQTYRVSSRWGERILIADITGAPRTSELWNSSDFLLFDDAAVLVHDYDPAGVLHGGWLIEARESVEPYMRLASSFIDAAIPLAMFERKQGLG